MQREEEMSFMYFIVSFQEGEKEEKERKERPGDGSIFTRLLLMSLRFSIPFSFSDSRMISFLHRKRSISNLFLFNEMDSNSIKEVHLLQFTIFTFILSQTFLHTIQ